MRDRQIKNKPVLKTNCTNPVIGKFLRQFNALKLGKKRRMDYVRFRAIVDHLLECKFCRRNLNDTGIQILTHELFWEGNFLSGLARIERRRMWAEYALANSHHTIKVIDQILERFRRGEFTEELKTIEEFLKD